MRVFALDLATTTGWAHDPADGGIPVSGRYRLVEGERGFQFLRFNQWLYDATAGYDAIAYEEPIFAPQAKGRRNIVFNRQTTMKLVGLAAQAEMIAAARRMRVFAVTVGTCRKHFVGSARSPGDPKMLVRDRCRALGWPFVDDNAADALAVWCWCKSKHDRTFRVETGTPLFGSARP